MSIDIRQKGADGEREVYNMLNPIIQRVMRSMDFPEDEVEAAGRCIQRNQNQSAVGGNDLTNAFGMSIEVKRQEALSVNTWWKQCSAAAERNKEHPVLLYRQNRKKWNCVTMGWLELPGAKYVVTRVQMDEEAFLSWFENWVRASLTTGAEVRT